MTHRNVLAPAFALALGATSFACAAEQPAPSANAPLPPGPPAPPPRITGPVQHIDAVIRVVLYSPDGRPDGLLLQDGTVVRFPPHTVRDGGALRAGSRISATGPGVKTPGGMMIVDAELASSDGRSLTTATPPPGPLPPR